MKNCSKINCIITPVVYLQVPVEDLDFWTSENHQATPKRVKLAQLMFWNWLLNFLFSVLLVMPEDLKLIFPYLLDEIL
jgi:hypothetical protein